MAYRKSSRNQNFTVIYQEVAQHESMSMEARGLLLFMLSLPENWDYHKSWLEDQCPGWGRDKLAKVLKELEEKGYLIRTPKRSEDGKKLSGWDWEVLAESALAPDSRKIRHSDTDTREIRTQPDSRIFSQTENQSLCKSAPTKETVLQSKKVSQSATRARENFFNRVMTELQADNLPERKLRYASMKIWEYQERYPDSDSVPDCWSYVVRAVQHQMNLTGS